MAIHLVLENMSGPRLGLRRMHAARAIAEGEMGGRGLPVVIADQQPYRIAGLTSNKTGTSSRDARSLVATPISKPIVASRLPASGLQINAIAYSTFNPLKAFRRSSAG